jgi:hypothetical protein
LPVLTIIWNVPFFGIDYAQTLDDPEFAAARLTDIHVHARVMLGRRQPIGSTYFFGGAETLIHETCRRRCWPRGDRKSNFAMQ